MVEVFDPSRQPTAYPDSEESTKFHSDEESNESITRSTSDSHSINEAHSITLSPTMNSIPISRPLSRSSATSGLSVTATKDGIEGKRIKKHGIPGYTLNLIDKMYANNLANRQTGIGSSLNPNENSDVSNHDPQGLSTDYVDDGASIMSLSSMIPQYSKEGTPLHDFESDNQSKKECFEGSEMDKELHDGDYSFDVKSSGRESLDSSDYKTFLRRSSGV